MGNRFLKWLDNYWYHYKWRTIVILFFAVLLIVCVVQCSTVEKYDLCHRREELPLSPYNQRSANRTRAKTSPPA